MSQTIQSASSSPANLSQGQSRLPLALLCAAQFMVVLDATIVLVALPSIGGALKFAPQDLSWVVTAYTLFFGGFLLLGGRAADLFGRRRLFRVGLAIFAFGSLLCALSPSSGLLVAARALQGFGAAMVSPAALAILMTLFGEGEARNRALGVWGALGAVGAAAGLLLGGILTTWLGWQSIFFVNVPIGIVVLALTPRLLPQSEIADGVPDFDFPGAVTLTAGLVLLVYAIVGISSNGWLSATTLGFCGIAIALLAAFVVIESRAKNPLVRLTIFQMRSLTFANLISLILSATQGAMFFLLTLYMQDILRYSPLRTGFALLPVAIGVTVFSNLASRLVARFGIKPLMIIGLITFGFALALLVRLPVDGVYSRDLLPTFLIASVGMGCSFVAITIGAFAGVPDQDAGLASGLINTTQQFGSALGIAILGTIAASQAQSVLGSSTETPAILTAQVGGYQVAFAVAVGLVIVTLLLALFGLNGNKLANQRASDVRAVPSATPAA